MTATEIVSLAFGAAGLVGGLIAFFWRKFDQMQDAAQKKNAQLIEERHRQKCAELDDHSARIRALEENRYKDMREMTDRFLQEVREIEHGAHTDRLAVVSALGEVKGAIQVVNQSTDRATKDIGALRSMVEARLHETDQKIAALEADTAALAERRG